MELNTNNCLNAENAFRILNWTKRTDTGFYSNRSVSYLFKPKFVGAKFDRFFKHANILRDIELIFFFLVKGGGGEGK